MDDGVAVEVIEIGEDALLELIGLRACSLLRQLDASDYQDSRKVVPSWSTYGWKVVAGQFWSQSEVRSRHFQMPFRFSQTSW